MFWKAKKGISNIDENTVSKKTIKSSPKILALLEKQRSIPLDFFAEKIKNSDEKKEAVIDSYESLIPLIYPYNIGYHFRRGTESIRNPIGVFHKEHPERVKQLMLFIQDDIIKLNLYMEKQQLQYYSFDDIRKIKVNLGLFPIVSPFQTHQHFLGKIKNYYLYIFPLLKRIVTLLDDDTIQENIKTQKIMHVIDKCYYFFIQLDSAYISTLDEWNAVFLQELENPDEHFKNQLKKIDERHNTNYEQH